MPVANCKASLLVANNTLSQFYRLVYNIAYNIYSAWILYIKINHSL